MAFPNLVVPFNGDLIARLTDRVMAVRVDQPSDIVRAVECVASSKNRLTSVILDAAGPLDEIPFDESWVGVNLAVFARGMEHFRSLFRRLELIRRIDPVVYFAVDSPENRAAIRILSSVNVRTAAVFHEGDPVDWEGLMDLMTYALVGPAPHAPIEPFSTIASEYPRTVWVHWGSVYFDNPREFFHLNAEGSVALSRRGLLEGVFVDEDADRLDDIITSASYRERIDIRKRFFLEYHPCSRCPGWCLCLGAFSQSGNGGGECAEFFTEMIDLLDEHRDDHNRHRKDRHDHRHL